MVASTWSEFTAGLNDEDLALITTYRDFCRELEGVEERVHRSEVQYAVKRIFTSAYVKSHYLEIGLELVREAEHPKLRTAFATSKRVTMHRITLREEREFDDALRELIDEARQTVGPGFT
ncbi:DUF5655 domain-containing protein [Demequina aurantiaca]|uniref:DUF5655 domain-containing protein n=1 Tax=Demequina aurantiaca TaxID=676200 RepID=UPI000784E6D0|nr:DUF5655 domain-containing protein [Demequina aurantiaca]